VVVITPDKKIVWEFVDHTHIKSISQIQVLDIPGVASDAEGVEGIEKDDPSPTPSRRCAVVGRLEIPAVGAAGMFASLCIPGSLWVRYCLYKLFSEMSQRPCPIGPFYEPKSIQMFPAEITGLVKIYAENTNRARQFLGGGFDP
jgi:hypothetical protein